MLVELLLGSLIAILTIDRFHRVVQLVPWLFDFFYYLLFSKSEYTEPIVGSPETSDILETENFFKIPDLIDDSLDNLLETIYALYFDPIGNMLNLNLDSHKSLRIAVRRFFSDFCRRLSKVDPESLFINNFIPKLTFHLTACKRAIQISDSTDKHLVHKAYPKSQIHSGVLFHDSDDDTYLKNLFESVLHLSLPRNQQNSKFLILILRSVLTFYVFKPLIDYLSKANNLRFLISRICQMDGGVSSNEPLSYNLVPLLQRFVDRSMNKYTVVATPPKNFMLSWKQLQSHPSLLFICLQVMKTDSKFIFPHFCTTLDDWNSKVNRYETNPKNSQDHQILHLITEAQKIFKVFICPESFHRIKFSKDISDKLEEINFHDFSEQNLALIKSSFNLTYNIAYDILVTECLDYFYRSPQFFMLCFGERPKIDDRLYAFHLQQSRKEFGIRSSISEKAIDETQYHSTEDFEDEQSPLSSDNETMSDSMSVGSNYGEQSFNIDLSKLKVEITDLRTSWKKNGKMYLFVISVSSQQLKEDGDARWEVARHYKEFYGLENRLKRFHGGRITNFLPPKRSILFSKNYDYLKNCRKPFQDYLESLLQNEYLKYSSMVYAFLTQETGINASSFFSKTLSIDTGRALQSVIGTISTEKGKYIDSFINTFATSIEVVKPKPTHKASFSKIKKKFTGPKEQYMPNSGLSKLHWSKPNESKQRDLVHEIFQAFIEIAEPSNVVNTVIHLFYAVFGGISELFFRRRVSDGLRALFSPGSISGMINFVTNYVAEPMKFSRTEISDSQLIAKINDIIPRRYSILIGKARMKEMLLSFVHLIKYEDLNKQILYAYLDDIFASIYPELIDLRSTKASSNNNFVVVD